MTKRSRLNNYGETSEVKLFLQ